MRYNDEFKTNEDGTITRTRLYVKKDGTPYKTKEKTFYKDKPKENKSHIPTGFLFSGKSVLLGILVFLIVVTMFRVIQDKPLPTFEGLIYLLQDLSNGSFYFDSWFIETETLPTFVAFLASIWNIIVWLEKGITALISFCFGIVVWILF